METAEYEASWRPLGFSRGRAEAWSHVSLAGTDYLLSRDVYPGSGDRGTSQSYTLAHSTRDALADDRPVAEIFGPFSFTAAEAASWRDLFADDPAAAADWRRWGFSARAAATYRQRRLSSGNAYRIGVGAGFAPLPAALKVRLSRTGGSLAAGDMRYLGELVAAADRGELTGEVINVLLDGDWFQRGQIPSEHIAAVGAANHRLEAILGADEAAQTAVVFHPYHNWDVGSVCELIATLDHPSQCRILLDWFYRIDGIRGATVDDIAEMVRERVPAAWGAAALGAEMRWAS